MRTGKDQPIADPVLQRDTPAPASIMSNRAGIGNGRPGGFCLHGQRAVGVQPMGPVLIAGLQGLLDQQSAKPGAVDEEVALDLLAIVEHERADEAGLALLAHLIDPALHAADAELLGHGAQEFRIQPGIEMIGEIDRDLVAGGELSGFGGLVLKAVFIAS